jgi:hypothetical protein
MNNTHTLLVLPRFWRHAGIRSHRIRVRSSCRIRSHGLRVSTNCRIRSYPDRVRSSCRIRSYGLGVSTSCGVRGYPDRVRKRSRIGGHPGRVRKRSRIGSHPGRTRRWARSTLREADASQQTQQQSNKKHFFHTLTLLMGFGLLACTSAANDDRKGNTRVIRPSSAAVGNFYAHVENLLLRGLIVEIRESAFVQARARGEDALRVDAG